MKQKMAKKLLCIAVAGMMFPMAAQAADADLQLKVDKLTQEVNDLKGTVQRNQDRSLSKWLSIGGEYRFRVDSLRGETVGYTDPNKMFTAAGNFLQSEAFHLGTGIGSFGMPAGDALLGFMDLGNTMKSTTTYAAARNFLGTNPMIAAGALNMLAPMGAVEAYKPKNETLYTNKFALDLHAKATQDVTVNVKLAMYKSFGSQDDNATTGNYFSDRVGAFDGTLGHVPSTGLLDVDRAYATWSNIAEQPVWFSVGRRPATNGAPSNLKLNNERPGNGGTPALLVDYAFDGMTIGYAPDIEVLPGFYTKLCYGRGFDSGFKTSTNSVKDTDMLGLAIIPVDTDPLRVWLQWNRGFNIFDFPVMSNSTFGDTAPSTNLGSIDWYGAGAMSTLKNVGPGSLNFFADFGLSITHPNDNVSGQAGFQGLGTGSFFNPAPPEDKTGWAAYAGVRYDLPSKTKLGFEFNHGSKDWITFAPASDDMWTSKVGVRGNVYEPYIIQELDLKPISSYFSKAFFKLGYQYYDFEYTGSNNWVGAPVKISDINPTNNMMLLAPVKTAQDVYATFEVKF
ncbi:MAG: DUF3373 domain-containing protein [Desulfuromonadaceae bacterium]|nr:DUF3373 domain-containing protein [Desulfuromonadaceae bacterium]